MNRKMISVVLVLTCLSLAIASCINEPVSVMEARAEVQERIEGRNYYVPQNDLEFRNYNRRQILADDPTALLWCTSAFPIPSSPIFTVPIVGKLTSGNKRPYPVDRNPDYTTDRFLEAPGPDGMYGTSGEYRYGYTPGGIYADWYNMPTFCTTEPTIWQRESTVIVLQTDPILAEAHRLAREALAAGNEGEATRILEEAVNTIQGR